MLTNKMCNPTHREVKINWDKGINITIPPDGTLDLSVEQMDDYRSGKPGSEEVREQTDINGVFLLDMDRDYDEQALEALTKCRKKKEDQLHAFTERLRDMRSASGIAVDDNALEEAKKRGGYNVFETDIETLTKRINIIRKVVSDTGTVRAREEIDPKKTCFATQPPREFPSETALAMFLVDKDADFVARHTELQTAMLEG